MKELSPIKNKVQGICICIILLCFLCLVTTETKAHPRDRYPEQKPLVVLTNRDFPPYEFLNEDGEPDGFLNELIKAILDKMEIPYILTTKENYQATYWFEKGEADLIVDPVFVPHQQPCYTSRSILDYYRLKVATNINATPIETLGQLKNAEKLVVGEYDHAGIKTLEELRPDSAFEMVSPKEAFRMLSSGERYYMLGGDEPLKWSIHQLGLTDSIVLSPLSIILGEFHFVAHDKELIDLIDDYYARMDQNGELYQIRQKWFNPEEAKNNMPYTVLFSTILLILFVIGLVYINRKLHKKEDHANRETEELHHMMQLALLQSDYDVMEYDLVNDKITNTHGNMLPEGGINFQQLQDHIYPDDREKILKNINLLKEGKLKTCELSMRWRSYKQENPDEPRWIYITGHLLAEKDSSGQVRYLVSTLKDITHEHEEEEKARELTNRFEKIFETTLVAMSFYEKEGRLLALNTNMRKLSGYDEASDDSFFHTVRLQDAPIFKGDFDPSSPYHMHVCQHMYYPDLGIDRYIEVRILPTYENGELLYYVVTARDITAERAMYMELYNQEKELRVSNEKRPKYESELRYLLENSNMWVWNSSLTEKKLHFSRTLQENEFTLTFEEFINNIFEEQRALAMNAFRNMVGTDENFNITLHFRRSPVNPDPQWIAISGIPMHDEKGQLTGHFGIVRDVTELMEKQEKLRQETSRAEDSGKLKSVFLANMTHEIRTPLNAIVGFSDLLQVIDTTEERREFMRIIRNNCDMLIRLINDIIEASNMNRGPLSIEADDVDFAIAFNDICQTLAQRVQEPGVEFIVDNPYKSFPTHLDKGRLQQVITNFTTNAVKYTHEGHIKVGYRCEENKRSDNGKTSTGIYMYCEDTGAGIPKDKHSSVFDRFVKLNDFVQGTGLGLSICKSIADRCGGHIGVTSEGEGHGSTFWIWIPCETSQLVAQDTSNI